MAQLIVRDLPEEIVRALKRRAAKHNHSTEQEHRDILEGVLRGPKKRPFVEVLCDIPDVGEDQDFERAQQDRRA